MPAAEIATYLSTCCRSVSPCRVTSVFLGADSPKKDKKKRVKLREANRRLVNPERSRRPRRPTRRTVRRARKTTTRETETKATNNKKKEKAHATTHHRAKTGSEAPSTDLQKNRDIDDGDDDDEAAGAEEAHRRKQKKRINGGNDALDAPREARTTRIGRAPGSKST